METTTRLEFGPLEVEIHALDGEDYQEEVLDLIQFIEDNQDSLEEIHRTFEAPEIDDSNPEPTSLEQFQDPTGDEEEESEEESGPLSEIASELRVSEHSLENFIYVDPEKEDYPVLYLDEVGSLGKKKTDKQRVASLILLYLWHECYGPDRVKSSSLKDALELSDISSSGMGNMYQGDGDRYFDRRGRGPSATVRLTPPGKRQARKILKRLIEEEEA